MNGNTVKWSDPQLQQDACVFSPAHVYLSLRMSIVYTMGVARGGSGGSEEPPSLTMAMDYALLKS